MSRAGRAWGRLLLRARAGPGSCVGTGSHGRQARCSGKECHAASVWGPTARSSSGERGRQLQPALHVCGFPGTLMFPTRWAATPGTARSSPRHNQKARGNLPVLLARARQPAVIPAAVAKFLHCCPRKASRQPTFAGAAPWESPVSGTGAAERPSHASSALPQNGDTAQLLMPLARSGWGEHTWAVIHLLPPPLKAEEKNGTRSSRNDVLIKALERKL